jgi:hypothetical protein
MRCACQICLQRHAACCQPQCLLLLLLLLLPHLPLTFGVYNIAHVDLQDVLLQGRTQSPLLDAGSALWAQLSNASMTAESSSLTDVHKLLLPR